MSNNYFYFAPFIYCHKMTQSYKKDIDILALIRQRVSEIAEWATAPDAQGKGERAGFVLLGEEEANRGS